MMRNTIVLDVDGVYTTDFNQKLSAPELMESREGGITILFNDIEELKAYRDHLPAQEEGAIANEQEAAVKAKLISSLNKVMRDNQSVLDATKAYAQAVFAFIFNAEAHRQDKLLIFESMIAEISDSSNSWELEKAIQDSTFELGIPEFNHKITFYNYAHNEADYSFEKIKSRLMKDLLGLKLSLTEQ